MASKVFLRHDVLPTPQQIQDAQHEVTIYAPRWVEEALAKLTTHLSGRKFQVFRTGTEAVYSEFEISSDKPITLKQLQMMARNERRNTSGAIEFSNYAKDIDPAVILSLKDLVRQCVLIGKCETQNYGGYPSSQKLVPQKASAYACDLAALQFQQPANSGRLVLYNSSLRTGVLDDTIFQNVVGEPKPSFDEVEKIVKQEGSNQTRFVRTRPEGTYFDAFAYKQFVTADVVLTGKALCNFVAENPDPDNPEKPICFKFLKYGTGFFAGDHRNILEANVLAAVVEGIETVVREDEGKTIKSLEFPFYAEPPKKSEIIKSLEKLKSKYGVGYKFTKDDALKASSDHVTATTNCADPHASFGNEMGYGSVDAAIAQNLKLKGVQFIPALNTRMKEAFLSI